MVKKEMKTSSSYYTKIALIALIGIVVFTTALAGSITGFSIFTNNDNQLTGQQTRTTFVGSTQSSTPSLSCLKDMTCESSFGATFFCSKPYEAAADVKGTCKIKPAERSLQCYNTLQCVQWYGSSYTCGTSSGSSARICLRTVPPTPPPQAGGAPIPSTSSSNFASQSTATINPNDQLSCVVASFPNTQNGNQACQRLGNYNCLFIFSTFIDSSAYQRTPGILNCNGVMNDPLVGGSSGNAAAVCCSLSSLTTNTLPSTNNFPASPVPTATYPYPTPSSSAVPPTSISAPPCTTATQCTQAFGVGYGCVRVLGALANTCLRVPASTTTSGTATCYNTAQCGNGYVCARPINTASNICLSNTVGVALVLRNLSPNEACTANNQCSSGFCMNQQCT